MPETQREDKPIDFQAELHHLDEYVRSKIDAQQESDPDKREQIERAAVAVEAAKQRFYLLNQQGPGADQEDPELLRLLNAAQQSARQLDGSESGGGPPLA